VSVLLVTLSMEEQKDLTRKNLNYGRI
jgi:hypothetical protein